MSQSLWLSVEVHLETYAHELPEERSTFERRDCSTGPVRQERPSASGGTSDTRAQTDHASVTQGLPTHISWTASLAQPRGKCLAQASEI